MQDVNNTNGGNSVSGSVMSELDVVKLGMDVCETLEPYARINSAHKGVSPDNIFCGWSGEYVLGSPADGIGDEAFAAPELKRAAGFDARADIYSLGMVLAYLLGDKASAASDELNAIIRKACAPDPDKRYQNVSEMKNALMNLHASKYFNGVTVSIADEVTAQTGGVSALRKDIQQTEQNEQKHRIAEDNAKRMTAAAFTAPWDDTLVVNIPEENAVTADYSAQTSTFDASDTRISTPVYANSDLHDMADELLDQMSDCKRGGYRTGIDDEVRRDEVIASARAVTDAQRIAYENKQKKKNKDRSMGTSGKKTLAVAIIVAVAALLLLGCIIAGIVLIGSMLGAGGDDVTDMPHSLSIVSEAEKLTYYSGEQISVDGLMLEAVYEDGATESVSGGFTISPATAQGVGTQTVTVTYNGVTVTYEITVMQKEVSSLYIEALPSRREFSVGEEFDLSGMVIDVLFADGSHEMINDGYTFEPMSATELGETKVTVSYGERSVSFVVNIVEIAVDAIEVIEMPTKLSYYVGESFDTAGLIILADYPNGVSGEVSAGFTVSPEKFTAAGKQTVVVSYGGKSLEFEVEVSRANLTRLAVRNMPTKTSYTVGESLSMKGFSMWAYYDNGTSQIITNSYTYTPTKLTKAGTQYITVTYMGKTTGFNVTVTEAKPTVTITKIAVATSPNKTTYMVGDSLDSAGLSITVYYSDGKTQTLTSGFTCSPTTFNTAGKASVSVSYGGLTTSFSVNVSAPITRQGTCGAKAKWTLSGGVLKISGTGDIDNYTENGAPWSEYGTQVRTVTIESGITSVGAYAFASTAIETLNIPDTLRRIDKTALYNTAYLATINLDAGNRSFIYKNASLLSRDGTKLYAVALGAAGRTYTVPDGVTAIEGYKVFYRSNVREIAINKDLYSIDPTTFMSAHNLEKFTVDARNVALTAKDGVLYTKNMNALVCYPSAKANSSYTIPEGVTVIREGAFAYSTKLRELTLPASLSRVDNNAFQGTNKLASVIFEGTQAQWNNVTKGSGNSALTEAPIKIMQ